MKPTDLIPEKFKANPFLVWRYALYTGAFLLVALGVLAVYFGPEAVWGAIAFQLGMPGP